MRNATLPILGALGLAGLLGLAAPNAFATGETGLYLGGGAGQTHGDQRFDDEAEHWKLIGGYNFSWLPFLDVGGELAYVNAGTLEGTANGGSASLNVESVQATGVLGWSLGPLGLYGKAGMADWDAERRGTGIDADLSGTSPVYGLGVRAGLLDVTGRLEVERLDTDDIGNLDMVTASVVYTF
ncbi:outer membrane beta-barrel protein [Halomonas almeriensis]|uniref:outer membrane beta-barrel protein n=1 Tax=Halomonas almeriensis TaxID=308163 RepID=UPI0025B59FD7|nr:outer membrane beta-barrel protein [Halomonas almeriensis]MDN3554297.1 outer membrane beta-barrel protein [Halomonas almeriensis]